MDEKRCEKCEELQAKLIRWHDEYEQQMAVKNAAIAELQQALQQIPKDLGEKVDLIFEWLEMFKEEIVDRIDGVKPARKRRIGLRRRGGL